MSELSVDRYHDESSAGIITGRGVYRAIQHELLS